MGKTKFTIFFSWQSDTNGNRKIIKDSILAECQKQKEKNGNWNVNDMLFDFNHRGIGKFSSAKDCDLSFEIALTF